MTQDTFLAELIDINDIPSIVDKANSCYDLTNNQSTSDSIYTSYFLFHGDMPLLQKYSLDISEENKIEIVSLDGENGVFQFYYRAGFRSNNPGEPEFPAYVRFYDIVIENN